MSGPTLLRQRRARVLLISALVLAASLPAAGYVAAGTAGALVTFNTDSGSVVVRRPGVRAALALPTAPARDLAIRLNVRTDRQPVGPGQVLAVILRRTAAGEYRARMQFAADGRVVLSVIRLVGAVPVRIAGPVVVALDWAPGERIALRVDARGTSPARIAIKVWRVTRPEPADPQLAATSVAPALDLPGTTALRFALPADAGNAPVEFVFDGLTISSDAADGGPAPSPTPGTPDPTPPAPEVTPTAPSPTASATPEPTPTATTPAPTASPTPIFLPPQGAYYVSTQGDDAAPGTPDEPWRTPQKAADSVPPGATVVLRAGTYPAFVVRRSGRADAPTTYTSFPGEIAVIDGHGAATYVVRLTGVSDVTVAGLVVQGGFAERQNGGGIMVENSTRVLISSNILRDNRAFGVRSYGSTYVTIADNDVSHNAVGISVGRAGEGTVIERNQVHENDQMMINTPDIRGDDVGAGGIALVTTTGHVVVRDNLVWGHRAQSYDYGYDGSAFEIYAASNWEFSGNTAWDNRVVFETGTDANRTPCSNGVFVRNVAYGPASVDVSRGVVLRCAENALIANNTFVGLQDFVFTLQHQVGTYGGSIDGLRIVNNVIEVSTARVYSIDTAIPDSVRFDANLMHITGTGTLAQMTGRGSTRSLTTFQSWRGDEMRGLVADPQFVARADHDYRLSDGSPGIDSGLDLGGVTSGFFGSAPDRGSIETAP